MVIIIVYQNIHTGTGCNFYCKYNPWDYRPVHTLLQMCTQTTGSFTEDHNPSGEHLAKHIHMCIRHFRWTSVHNRKKHNRPLRASLTASDHEIYNLWIHQGYKTSPTLSINCTISLILATGSNMLCEKLFKDEFRYFEVWFRGYEQLIACCKCCLGVIESTLNNLSLEEEH